MLTTWDRLTEEGDPPIPPRAQLEVTFEGKLTDLVARAEATFKNTETLYAKATLSLVPFPKADAPTPIAPGMAEVFRAESVLLSAGVMQHRIPALVAEMRRFCDAGKKVEAIKLVREHTGWDLKGSKDFIEKELYS